MSIPTRQAPRMVEGVWFPVRYVWQYNCFEDGRYNLISCEKVGDVANRLAGRPKRRRPNRASTMAESK